MSAAIIVCMKKLIPVCKKTLCMLLSALIIFCIPSIFLGCIDNNTYDGELLRLHIRMTLRVGILCLLSARTSVRLV